MESVEEMKEFENILLNKKEKREQCKTVIKREGGKDIGEHGRRAMRRIITNTLAIKYSWSRQKKTIRFKDLLISKLIVDSMVSAHASTNIKKLEDAIQLWLNHASDREKKRKREKIILHDLKLIWMQT
ncbi:uncharacterized protein LOC116843626 isoform X2 [Odontomachus brunneus]|uniref:uncharacterized protein LOC116843626 isoform X2 n=1 Tax=Odontomachus brunneus TaxID=486640 RepID=UPI0013F1A66A|nr:uncharacterized protein LOC116843626 isoform X2 [Odontomachus brunneus]XP_032670059.1 uncharacterized protein LOC116843626 isoform X2 [Odontomachus brunneus]